MINNNVATEITHLQKNMVALKSLAPSENFLPLAPSFSFSFFSHVFMLKLDESYPFISLIYFVYKVLSFFLSPNRNKHTFIQQGHTF